MTRCFQSCSSRLGDTQSWGTQTRVYTLRGWVLCDTWKEVDEELRRIDSLSIKEVCDGRG